MTEFVKMVYSVPENQTIHCNNVKEPMFYVTDEKGDFTIVMEKTRLMQEVYVRNKERFFRMAEEGLKEMTKLAEENIEKAPNKRRRT